MIRSASRWLQTHGRLLLLTTLACAVRWKGGETLEVTWLLCAVAILLTWLSATQSSGVPKKFWILGMVYIALSWLSYAFSQTANYGLDEVLRTTALLLIIAWWSSQKRDDSSLLSRTGLLVLNVACLIGAIVYVAQPVERFVGTFFDYGFVTDYWPNAFGTFVLFAWPLAVPALHRMRFPWQCLLSGFLLACFFLTYSRGAMIAFGLQVAVLLCIHLWNRSRVFSRRSVIAGAAALLTAISVVFALNELRALHFPVTDVAAKATFTAAEGSSSISERAQFWKQAVHMSLDAPLLGYGPYSFRFVQPSLAEGVLATSDHPHNAFLKVAAERGWPAAVVLLTAIVVLLMYRLPSVTNTSAAARWHTYLLLALLGGFAHSMIDYNVQFVGVALLVALILAELLKGTPGAALGRVQSRAAVSVSIFLLAVCVWEGAFLVTSSLGRHAQAAGSDADAQAYYELSKPERFSRDMLLSLAHLQSQTDTMAAVATLKAYLHVNAHDARAWQQLGDVYLERKELAAALDAFTNAYKRGKYTHAGILRGMLETSFKGGGRLPLTQDDALALWNAYADAILVNAHFIALSMNVEEVGRIAELLGEDDSRVGDQVFRKNAEVQQHAVMERDRLGATAPGFLW